VNFDELGQLSAPPLVMMELACSIAVSGRHVCYTHTVSHVAVLQLITITDGEPTNEPERKIFQVIKQVKDFMSRTPYGPKAIAFEFAQARVSAPSTYTVVTKHLLQRGPGYIAPANILACDHVFQHGHITAVARACIVMSVCPLAHCFPHHGGLQRLQM